MRIPHSQWLVLAASTLTLMAIMALSSVLNLLRAHFGLSASHVGFLVTVYAAFLALASPLAGDAFSSPRVVRCALLQLIALRHRNSRQIKRFKSVLALMSAALLLSGCSSIDLLTNEKSKNPSDLILATTTSTYDTGLLDKLIPAFTERYSYKVKVLAVGTGEALAMGERGEADVLLVHAPAAEKAFMAAGYGTSRKPVMYNWFLLVGPEKDPAGARAAESITAAFQVIAENQAPFISRGDNSGTHQKELDLWKAGNRQPQGPWYQEVGQGMAATLRIADEKQAYALTDEGTFRAQQKSLSLHAIEFADKRLRNEYSVIVVTGSRAGADAFSRFLVSKQGQSLIRKFRSPGYDKPLFTPNAK